jgi:hypothetical protein
VDRKQHAVVPTLVRRHLSAYRERSEDAAEGELLAIEAG